MAARRYALVLNLFVFLRVEGLGCEGQECEGPANVLVIGGGEGGEESRKVNSLDMMLNSYSSDIKQIKV